VVLGDLVLVALVAIPALLIWTIYSRTDLPISRKDLLSGGVGRGLASAFPLILCAVLAIYHPLAPALSVSVWTLAAGCSVLVAIKYVLRAE